MGNRIKILSDHRALKFILTSMSDNPRLIRWRYLLQEFNPELYYLPGEQNLMADWYSRFAKATPGRTKMPMHDRFVAATEHTNLPRGVPETFNPPTIKMGINDMKDLLQLRGPLVVLSDTMSKVPLGPVGAMMDKIPSLKDYFAHRQINESTNFCTLETANTLGTYKKITGSPEVFLLFHTISYVSVENNPEQLQNIRSEAPPAVRQEIGRNNAAERAFFAQIAMEDLLNAWEHRPPSNKIYIVARTEPQDPGREAINKLINRFAYALFKRDLEPVLLTGRGFRKPSQALAKDQKHINYVDSESIEEIARQAGQTDNYPWTLKGFYKIRELKACLETRTY